MPMSRPAVTLVALMLVVLPASTITLPPALRLLPRAWVCWVCCLSLVVVWPRNALPLGATLFIASIARMTSLALLMALSPLPILLIASIAWPILWLAVTVKPSRVKLLFVSLPSCSSLALIVALLTAVRFRLRPAFTSLPLTSKSLPAFTVTLLPAFRTLPATVFWLSCSRLLRVSLPTKTLMPFSSPTCPIPSRRYLCSLPANSAILPAVMMTLRPPSNDRLLPASSTLPTTLTSCAALPVMLLPARITLAALVLAVPSLLLSRSLLNDTKSLPISRPKDFLWVLLSLKLSSCNARILRLPVSFVRPACSSTELSAATVL